MADGVQVRERLPQAREVGPHVVHQAVGLEERPHARRDVLVLELGHRREEVVLDLEVQVGHPPVAQGTGRDVRGVLRGVLDPVHELVRLGDRQVGMTQREVREDVARGDLVVRQVRPDGVVHAPQHDAEEQDVAEGHARQLPLPLRPQRVPRMQVELPARGDQQARDGDEQVALQPQPELDEGASGPRRDLGVEGHQGQRV